MEITTKQAEYIKKNYTKYGDKKLARALGVNKSWVKAARAELECLRTGKDNEWIHAHPQDQPAEFDSSEQTPHIQKPPDLNRIGRILVAASFILPLIVYLASICNQPSGENSAEMAVCVATGSLPQTPAAPLYLLFARLLVISLPFTPAAILNTLSAISAALAVSFILLIIYHFTRNYYISFFAAMVTAFSIPMWRAAVITSPYALALSFAAMSFYFLLRWQEQRNESYLAFCVITGSASIASHSLMLLFLPAFLLFFMLIYRRTILDTSLAVGSFLLGFLIFNLFLYLPLCSWSNPEINRSQIENFSDTFVYIIGNPKWLFEDTLSFGEILQNFFNHLLSLPGLLWPGENVFLIGISTLLLIGAAIYGCYLLAEKRKSLIILCTTTLFSWLIFLGFMSFQPGYHPSIDTAPLFILLLALASLTFAKLFEDRRKTIKIIGAVFSIVIIGQIYEHRKFCSYRSWQLPEIYGQSTQEHTDDKAIIVAHSDTEYFYLRYYLLVNKDAHYYPVNFFGAEQEIKRYNPRRTVDQLRTKFPGHSIYFTYVPFNTSWGRYFSSDAGPLTRITIFSPITRKLAKLPEYPLATPQLAHQEKYILSLCHLNKIRRAIQQNQITKALQSLEQAPFHIEQWKARLIYEAQQLTAKKDYASANKIYQLFIKIKPETKLYNALAEIAIKQNQDKRALEYYQKSLELAPKSFTALAGTAALHEKKGDTDTAEDIYRKMIEYYPKSPYAYRKLSAILFRKPGFSEESEKLEKKAQKLEKQQNEQKEQNQKQPKIPQIPGITKPNIPNPRPNLPNIPNPNHLIPQIGPKLPQLPKIPEKQH